MNKQDREFSATSEESKNNVEKTNKDYKLKIKTLNQSYTDSCKILEDKKTNLENRINDALGRLRSIQDETANIKIEKEKSLQELEGKLRKDLNNKIKIENKDLEEKLKNEEDSKVELDRKLFELAEEIKQQQKRYGNMVIRLNKTNGELREENSILQKNLSLKFSENVKIQQEIAIENNIHEVSYN